ncbi:MAG: DUF4957 domain-containing protein, partial [Prevotella sp.]|nr:DUF4957 domain-containing protein [Prevotella sp.]
MKSKLTLLMVALLSVCAFAATTWKATEETPVAAGSTLIDDELVTAKTVYETTLKTAAKEIAGEEFTHYIQVRVDAAPTAEEPNGTNKEGSTPIILTAKKDLTLKIYYRRQSTSQNEDSGVYASNDGKDLKIVNQADLSQLDGTLTIVEETEDFKYAWVTKEYELAEGNTYTIFGRGTTINYYGMTYEGKEPPAPVVGEAIELNPASGDISAELAAAMENNPYPASITINLAANGTYTVSQAIETVGNLTIQGDAVAPATIDASGLTAPMIQVKSDLAAFQPNETTGFYELGDVSISNVKVTGLAQQLIYGNKVKALYGKVALDNSIVEIAGGSKTVIDFNGGGVAEMVFVNNSTIYANPQHTGALYSSQSGQKATEAGLEKQTISITNSTLYNIAYAKNVNTHRQANQTFLAYELKNSVILDCGKEGQFVKGLNQGQAGKNPTWMIEGNSFLRTVEGVITDMSASEETGDEEEPVTNNVEGVAVFANDINTGDFTFDQCPQNEARIGDPRWLVEVKEAYFEGKYYLYNVGSQRYWGAANDWGTQASLIEHPDYVTLAQTPDGAYTMETQVSNGGTSYYFGGDYMDGQPVNLTITKAGDGLYTIANADGQLYGYDGNSYILGKNVPEGNNALWKIISEADMFASLNEATVNAPVDATFLIIDHTFGRNNRNVGVWKVSEDCTNYNLTGGNS